MPKTTAWCPRIVAILPGNNIRPESKRNNKNNNNSNNNSSNRITIETIYIIMGDRKGFFATDHIKKKISA